MSSGEEKLIYNQRFEEHRRQEDVSGQNRIAQELGIEDIVIPKRALGISSDGNGIAIFGEYPLPYMIAELVSRLAIRGYAVSYSSTVQGVGAKTFTIVGDRSGLKK